MLLMFIGNWLQQISSVFYLLIGWCPLGILINSQCLWSSHSGAKRRTEKLCIIRWHAVVSGLALTSKVFFLFLQCMHDIHGIHLFIHYLLFLYDWHYFILLGGASQTYSGRNLLGLSSKIAAIPLTVEEVKLLRQMLAIRCQNKLLLFVWYALVC